MFCTPLYAFDWPIENFDENAVQSNFGQERGGLISTSIVFSEPESIRASEDGNLLIIFDDESDDTDFFATPLGSAVILAHDDDLLTVYGNLDIDSLKEYTNSKTSFLKGDLLSECGSSGWIDERGTLEFQVIDLKKSIAINPKKLLTHMKKEKDLSLTTVYLQNKDGELIELKNVKNLQSGQYEVYQKKNLNNSPYKTTITMNGVVVDQIQYDTVGYEGNRVFVTGKKRYYSNEVYGKEDMQFLGEAMFTPGKSTFGIQIEDFLGNAKNLSYLITIY